MRGVLGVMLGLLCSLSLSDSPGSTSEREHELFMQLQTAIDEGVTIEKARGISATVILPDGQTWPGSSGMSYGDVLIGPATVFAAGSMGKSFTAAVVHQPAEEGLISLDDPIGMWLPEFAHIDPSIPIRLLLNHRSGLHQFIRHPELLGGDPWRGLLHGRGTCEVGTCTARRWRCSERRLTDRNAQLLLPMPRRADPGGV